MKQASEISLRAYPVYIMLALVGLIIIVKVFYIQFFSSGEKTEKGLSDIYRVATIEPSRGRIISSDGHLLATSVPMYELRWDATLSGLSKDEFYEKLDSLALGMSRVFGKKSTAEYKQQLTRIYNAKESYAKVETDINHLQRNEALKFPLIRDGRYKKGFFFEKQEYREKPFRNLAHRTIGSVQPGKFGLELTYNDVLSGKAGKRYEERIAGGRWRPMNDNFIEVPVNGADVISTINVHLQDVANKALKTQLEKHNAMWGTCILMEVETGYVRAMANLSRSGDSYEERVNIAADYNIEPGSTFKLVSLMAALDEGLIKPADSVETGTGQWSYKGATMKDSNWDKVGPNGKTGNGTVTIEDVFAKSSNIGTAKAILKAYEQNQQGFLDKINSFGVGEPLGLELQKEPAPRIRKTTKEAYWSGTDIISMSIGYSVSMTPLQLLAFYNGVINDGDVMRPMMAQETRLSNGKSFELKPHKIREIPVKNSTLDICLDMMEKTADTGGTVEAIFWPADSTKRPPYRIGGKTGTARIHENGSYQENKYRASFIGYFPADEPKYSCLVVISEPHSGMYYGSTVAAPVFKELADKIFATDPDFKYQIPVAKNHKLPVSKDGYRESLAKVYDYLGIKAEYSGTGQWGRTTTLADTVKLADKNIPEGLVPDVKGMGLRDALYLLENRGMRVEIRGAGTVKRQSVPAGSSLKTNKYITIELS